MKITSDKIPDKNDDLLGRKEFAKEIVNALLAYSKKNTDGITISITGEWGSGKSTLLHYLKNYLEKTADKSSIKIIDFNPWIFYKQGNIREAFLIHFALALNDFKTKASDISKKVKDFVSAFRFLKNISAVAGNIQDGLEKTLNNFSKNDSIPQIKEEIEKALLKRNQKIFILIDDVDRLTQSEILELLQIVSLVMNFSNVYYILAFDKEIILNAINKEYGNRGLDYLEKIIQVDYSIPLIKKERLDTLFFKMLAEISTDYKILFDNTTIKSLWNYHGLADYFTTIRDFKRFFNSLIFRLPVIANDINTSDFLAIEAIRLFDNDSYNLFYSFYNMNLRRRDMPPLIFKEEQLKQFRQPAIDIVKALSPKSAADYMRTDANLKRIYDPQYFERYFSLLRNENDISDRTLKEFMERPVSREQILKEATKLGKIKNLLKRLNDDEIGTHFPSYEYDVVEAVILFFNNHPAEFEKNPDKVSDVIINLICCSKEKDQFIRQFFLSFEGNNTYPNIIRIYFFHYMRMFIKENRSFRSSHYEFDAYYKKNYENIWQGFSKEFQKTSFAILEKKYTIECPFIKFLCLINYAELFPEDYRKQYPTMIQDIEFLLYVLSQFIWIREDFSLVEYRFKYRDVLFPGNLFPEFYHIIKCLNKSEYDMKNQAYIEHFLKINIDNYPEISFPKF